MRSTTIDPAVGEFVEAVGVSDAVSVVGGRTRWDLGGNLRAGATQLAAPVGVVEYQPAEMIVRVRAGTPVAELHAALAAAGQRTGLPERGGTVGGAIVVGEDDLHVLARGTVRGSVLQVRYVSSEGALVTGGGAVVKNVSGFNIPKVIVGSLGTLGLVAEVVLRTNPIPPTSLWLRSPNADPFAVFDLLLRPSAILWDGACTWVQLEGRQPDVWAEWQALGTLGTFDECGFPPALPTHRWSLPPGQLRALETSETGAFVASVGVGTLWADNPQAPRSPDVTSLEVAARMKQLFDPSGRLNPGRVPAVA